MKCLMVKNVISRDIRIEVDLDRMISQLSSWCSSTEELAKTLGQKIQFAQDSKYQEQQHEKQIVDQIVHVINTHVPVSDHQQQPFHYSGSSSSFQQHQQQMMEMEFYDDPESNRRRYGSKYF